MRLHARLPIPGVMLFEPEAYEDERGCRFEGHRVNELSNIVGRRVEFRVANICHSVPHSLRGMHWQLFTPQGKLVRCLHGSIYDAVVDLRVGSQTFGKWTGARLDEESRLAIWIPPGFAHGFLCGSRGAIVHYECTTYFRPEFARELLWNDPDIGIEWPIDPKHPPIISEKDRNAPPFARIAA